ncbi:MAG: NAD(P)/FAD-dependent oxidoreductase [Alphaproteobacteria bacterium]
MTFDIIVAGGSYAGLAAALQVARARRKVLVIDAGERRNRFAATSHGFLTQDGRPPEQIAREGREQLLAYPTVTWADARAEHAQGRLGAFSLSTSDGSTHTGRRLVLATGVADRLPDIPGLQERWGESVFHCPYCHGYETDGGPLGVLATGPLAIHQAMMLPDWGRTTLFTNGLFEPDGGQRASLAARGVTIEPVPVAAISGAGNRAAVALSDGRTVELAGLFTMSRTVMASPLAEQLGCSFEEGPFGPFIRTEASKMTSVPGVYACGDAAMMAGSVSFAVGDGARAGVAAHQSLIFTQ